MELFIKTIFWIATLHSFLHAFSASPVPFTCIDLQTEEMQTNVKCVSHFKLNVFRARFAMFLSVVNTICSFVHTAIRYKIIHARKFGGKDIFYS